MKIGNISYASPLNMEPSPELIEQQPRMKIEPDDLRNLENDIRESGYVRMPVIAYHGADGELLLLAGYNRWMIAKELKLQDIPCQIVTGTREEYRDFVVKENLNRRHFTAKQKRELAGEELKKNPEQSNRELSKKTNLSDKTIKHIRTELERTAEIPQLTHTQGRDGKTRPAVKKIQPKFKEKKTLSIIIDKNTTMNQRAQYINTALIICLSGLKGGEVNKLQSYIKSLLK